MSSIETKSERNANKKFSSFGRHKYKENKTIDLEKEHYPNILRAEQIIKSYKNNIDFQ